MEPTEYTHPDFLEIYDREPTFHQTYQPHIWAVRKDDIYDAIESLTRAIGWVGGRLYQARKDSQIDDRYLHKHEIKMLEHDLEKMQQTLKNLKSYDGSSEI
jgi:hypothetical protein